MTLTKQVIEKVVSDEFDKRLPAIKQLVENTIEEKVPDIIHREISFLPTKKEFYKKMDELLGEVKAMREEFHTTTEQVNRFEKQLGSVN